jgi:protein-disulfide isomerase
MKSSALAALAALLSAGCATSGEVSALRQELNALRADHEKLAARIDAQGKGGRPTMAFAPVPVEGAPLRGNPSAYVTIVQFEDYQCPFCARAEPTMRRIAEVYGSDVRFVMRHNPLPFHGRARPAALAAECAFQQGRFWQMHDLLFANTSALEDTDLERYAGQIGLDVAKWKECVEAADFERIDADARLAASVGARGTPAFFVNGQPVSGAQPFEAFQKVIDQELAKARASGIPAADYYRKAILKQ